MVFLVGGNVVGPQGAVCGICRRVDSGEGAELVGEVGLVIVAAVECQICPADIGTGVKFAYGVLETLDAAPDLGSKPDLFAKNLGEAPLTPADLTCRLANTGDVAGAVKVAEGKVDFSGARGCAPSGLACESLAEELLKIMQACPRSGKFAQVIAKRVGLRSPDIVKRNALVAEPMGCFRGEGCESSGSEDDADQVSHVGSVNDFVNRSCSYDKSGRHVAVMLAYGAVEQKIARQVDDDLCAAGRKDAFAAMVRFPGLCVPEHTNGLVERGGGDLLQVKQSGLVVFIA